LISPRYIRFRALVFLIDLLGVAMLFAVTCLQAAGSRLRLRASS
jgi:uncharacterized membrane protein